MSHISEEVDVTVTLQDKDGNQVYRKDDIKIAPMDTYDLNMKVENLSAGDYELIIYSQLPGAQAWQEDLDITVNEYSETTGEDISKYPEYKANTVYNSGDIVSKNGELYQCKTNVAGFSLARVAFAWSSLGRICRTETGAWADELATC